MVRRDDLDPTQPPRARGPRDLGQPRRGADVPDVPVARPDRREARRCLHRHGPGDGPLARIRHANQVPGHPGLPRLPPRASGRQARGWPLAGVPAVPVRRARRVGGEGDDRAADGPQHHDERDVARARGHRRACRPRSSSGARSATSAVPGRASSVRSSRPASTAGSCRAQVPRGTTSSRTAATSWASQGTTPPTIAERDSPSPLAQRAVRARHAPDRTTPTAPPRGNDVP